MLYAHPNAASSSVAGRKPGCNVLVGIDCSAIFDEYIFLVYVDRGDLRILDRGFFDDNTVFKLKPFGRRRQNFGARVVVGADAESLLAERYC